MDWTKHKIEALKTADIEQLRANARARGSVDIVALCDEVLRERPKSTARGKAKCQHEPDGRPLVSRGRAFEMRGVKLHNPRWSWGGLRSTDGMVVFTVWAGDVETKGSARRYMLFGPIGVVIGRGLTRQEERSVSNIVSPPFRAVKQRAS